MNSHQVISKINKQSRILKRSLYFSFYGAQVNITALPFPPYWDERESTTGRYHGTDYLMINAIGLELNFTVTVLPSTTWSDVRPPP